MSAPQKYQTYRKQGKNISLFFFYHIVEYVLDVMETEGPDMTLSAMMEK